MIKERWQEGPRPKTPSPRPRFPVSLTLSLKHKPLNHRTRRELRVQQDTIQEMLEPQPSLLEEPGPEFTHDALPRESGDHGFGVREGAHEVRAMLDRLMLVVVVGEGVLSLAGSSVLVLVVWGKTEIRHDQTTLMGCGPVARREVRWRPEVLIVDLVVIVAAVVGLPGSVHRSGCLLRPCRGASELNHRMHVAASHRSAACSGRKNGWEASFINAADRGGFSCSFPGRYKRYSMN
ncbi:hypothetical protein KC320_g236 [Hortaea werneckii]|nr:hypothetical protein KC320_g236 [Hortaea werneckii]